MSSAEVRPAPAEPTRAPGELGAMDPNDQQPGPTSTWTIVNMGEAVPGVPTPLAWTWEGPPMEQGLRGGFSDVGALPRAVRALPDHTDDAFIGIFRGRAALNVGLFRAMGDAIPGASGDKVERELLGSVRSDAVSRPALRRYPMVAAKLLPAALRARRVLLRQATETDQWWRHATDQLSRGAVPGTAGSRAELARELLSESQRRYAEIGRMHITTTFVAQGVYSQLGALCLAVGLPGLEMELATFEVAESGLVTDLWDVAHGKRSLDDFLTDHGFHGPMEAELSVPSWRADPGPVKQLIARYREAEIHPSEQAEKSRTAHRHARAQLLATAGPMRGTLARVMLAVAQRYIPLREVGRGTFLRCYDVARAAAVALGEYLAAAGSLDLAEDVFYLTFDELVSVEPPADARALVATRRDLRSARLTERLPQMWTGPVQPLEEPSEEVGPLTGIGASPGIVEGNARVVLNPAEIDDFEAGDILVCQTTDPSWASLFFVASAAVIDIGGAMSHGAIVARELGLPCVINTKEGTTRVRSGQRVRVDGTTGIVTVL